MSRIAKAKAKPAVSAKRTFSNKKVTIEATSPKPRRTLYNTNKKLARRKPGYIYILAVRYDKDTYYKVGRSIDPEIRLKCSQTYQGEQLKIFKVWKTVDMVRAEWALKLYWQNDRSHQLAGTEWFKFSDKNLKLIKKVGGDMLDVLLDSPEMRLFVQRNAEPIAYRRFIYA